MRIAKSRYSASIKFRAVLDLLKTERSLFHVAHLYQVHPTTLKLWKDRFLDGTLRAALRRTAE